MDTISHEIGRQAQDSRRGSCRAYLPFLLHALIPDSGLANNLNAPLFDIDLPITPWNGTDGDGDRRKPRLHTSDLP